MNLRQAAPSDVARLSDLLKEGVPLSDAIARSLGGTCLASNAWRIFSGSFPAEGAEAWNRGEWRLAWGEMSPGFHAFGEDAFGNQLAIVPGAGECFLWWHETGELRGLELDPESLLGVVLEAGAGWLDAYRDDCLDVARPRLDVLGPDEHLHWVQPLVLGGQVTEGNLATVERSGHLVGHAHLWRQIRDVEPGTQIVVR